MLKGKAMLTSMIVSALTCLALNWLQLHPDSIPVRPVVTSQEK